MAYPQTQHHNGDKEPFRVFKTDTDFNCDINPNRLQCINDNQIKAKPFRNFSAPKPRSSSASLLNDSRLQKNSSATFAVPVDQPRLSKGWTEDSNNHGSSAANHEKFSNSIDANVYTTKDHTTSMNLRSNKPLSIIKSQGPASAKAKAAVKYLNAKLVTERLVKALANGEGPHKKVTSLENQEANATAIQHPKTVPCSVLSRDQLPSRGGRDYVSRMYHDCNISEQDPLLAKAMAFEKQAAIHTENRLFDVLIQTLVEHGEYDALEFHIDALQAEFRKHIKEKKELALQMASDVRNRIADRASMEQELRNLRADFKSKAQMLEREKTELWSQMQEETQKAETRWIAKFEKLKYKEKRMAVRLTEIAEEKVRLQKEVAALISKNNDIVENVKICEETIVSLKAKLEESGAEDARLKKCLENSGAPRVLEDYTVSDIEALELRLASVNEEELMNLVNRYKSREKLLAKEKERAVSKLERVCKEQEKTIQGLRLALLEDVGNGRSISNGELFVKLQKELLRLTGLEQSLLKEIDACRAEAIAAQQENAKLVESLSLATNRKPDNGASSQRMQDDENSPIQIDKQMDDQSMALMLVDQSSCQGSEGVAQLVQSRARLQIEANNLYNALSLSNRQVQELERKLATKEQGLKAAQQELARAEEQREVMRKEADYMGREAIRLSSQVEQLSKRVEKLDEDVMLKEGQLSILRKAFQQHGEPDSSD